MQHANFTAWAKACNLLDDKWYVYQYIRRLKTYHRQGQKCDEKTKKETKWQDSSRQDLIPDHGPQHGAVRCSTYWASILNSCIRCSTHCKDQALTHWRYSIEEKEYLLQWFVLDSISKKNFVLRFSVPFKKYLFFCIQVHYFYFASWAKAYNLFDDKWYVYQYTRTSKTYYQQG